MKPSLGAFLRKFRSAPGSNTMGQSGIFSTFGGHFNDNGSEHRGPSGLIE